MAETVEHIHRWIKEPPMIKFKLERGQKGTYAWEISYEGESSPEVIKKIQDADEKLKALYTPEPAPESNGK